jgi:hypothetical protein
MGFLAVALAFDKGNHTLTLSGFHAHDGADFCADIRSFVEILSVRHRQTLPERSFKVEFWTHAFQLKIM